MIKLDLKLKEKSVEILEQIAEEQEIAKERLCEIILNAWISFGGQIWSGDYKKTRAFIIDWPVRRNLIKMEDK